MMKWAIAGLAAALWCGAAAAGDFADRWSLRSPGTTVEPSQRGVASIYWEAQRTSTGERFQPYQRDPSRYTCAHPSYAMGTILTVHRGLHMIVCRVNDRGPNKSLGRVIDLPPPAAAELGISRKAGLGTVTVRRVQ